MAIKETDSNHDIAVVISNLCMVNPWLFANVPPVKKIIRERFLMEILNFLNDETAKSNII